MHVFDLQTATIADINAAFDAGALTSERLVELYLARIEAYDKQGPNINAVITLNPAALETARALDAERHAKGPRSPLHGVPVVLKDLFDTEDMPTTAGFLPMKSSQPIHDATVVKRLARRRRDRPREGQHERLVRRAEGRRPEHRARPHEQSVQPRPHAGRLERRHRRRARGRVRADRLGQRNRRVDPQSDREQQRRRSRADARPDPARGPGHDVVHAGARGPDGPLRLRRRRADGRRRGLRRRGSADDRRAGQHADGVLHLVPRPRAGCAAHASACSAICSAKGRSTPKASRSSSRRSRR